MALPRSSRKGVRLLEFQYFKELYMWSGWTEPWAHSLRLPLLRVIMNYAKNKDLIYLGWRLTGVANKTSVNEAL